MENPDDIAAFKNFSIENEETSTSKIKDKEPEMPQKTSNKQKDSYTQKPAATSHSSSHQGDVEDRIKASPYAKKLAAEQGVDLAVRFFFQFMLFEILFILKLLVILGYFRFRTKWTYFV